jgi:hypothetical protein
MTQRVRTKLEELGRSISFLEQRFALIQLNRETSAVEEIIDRNLKTVPAKHVAETATGDYFDVIFSAY